MENRQTADAIFKDIYYINTTKRALMLPEIDRSGGLMVNEDLYADRGTLNRIVSVGLPIDKIVLIYDKNYLVEIRNGDDVVRIHKAIYRHLNAWKEHLNKAAIRTKAPYIDLIKLDNFADMIFNMAKRFFKQEDLIVRLEDSIAVNTTNTLHGLSNLIKPIPSTGTKEEMDKVGTTLLKDKKIKRDDTTIERKEFSTFLKSRMMNVNTFSSLDGI